MKRIMVGIMLVSLVLGGCAAKTYKRVYIDRGEVTEEKWLSDIEECNQVAENAVAGMKKTRKGLGWAYVVALIPYANMALVPMLDVARGSLSSQSHETKQEAHVRCMTEKGYKEK